QFIGAWGSFGSNWGINRTMAQIHALLLVSSQPLSADEVMQELNISRGNANMNLRELINWGLIERVVVPGERREFFTAEKDIWVVARTIIKERKKRELEPMLKFLDSISTVQKGGTEEERAAFEKTMKDIRKFGDHANQSLDNIIKADENWFVGTIMKLFR
ncbi:MAG TPA: MarR family transcriptional regulator, partial [Phnomibacter sp.]|nr:MarR family transcriptional regulator [Phnomibacter sp.]